MSRFLIALNYISFILTMEVSFMLDFLVLYSNSYNIPYWVPQYLVIFDSLISLTVLDNFNSLTAAVLPLLRELMNYGFSILLWQYDNLYCTGVLPFTSGLALNISIKFLLGIVCLIFVRGGIPRFRFDYLTKLGWIRFLSLVLVSFLFQILILATF